MQSQTTIPVQVNINGFHGKPCSLLSLYDIATGALHIAKITDYNTERKDGYLVIGSDYRQDQDGLFSAELLGEAIEAYEAAKSSIEFGAEATRAKPDGQYQVDGYDANGPRRRIDSGLNNERVAALATCWGISKQHATFAAIALMNEVGRINRGSSPIDVYAYTV